MFKKRGILDFLLLLVVLFSCAFFAVAQDNAGNSTPTINSAKQENRDTIKTDRRGDVKEEILQKRDELRNRLEVKREEIRQTGEEIKDRIHQNREELKDRITAKREKLKENLKRIKDERKKQVVEKIDKALDALNERFTNHLLNVLDKLEDILNRIIDRTNKAVERGLDVSSVEESIDSAQKAIGEARTAIEEQADETYTIVINTEDNLRDEVKKARQALHADLRLVFEVVKAAKEAVHQTVRTLAGIVANDSSDGNLQVCTEEAKICPDGSAVGRIGPNCEFAACPEE